MVAEEIMEEEKNISPLIKYSFIYVVATVIGQGMSFAGIIVFTRVMNREDYGEYSTYYANVSILTVLIGMNLYYALNNAYIEKKDRIKEFRKSVLALSSMIMVAMTAVIFIAGCLVLKVFSGFVVVMAALHSYGFFVITYKVYSANMENDFRSKQWLLILPNTLQLLIALGFVLMLPRMSYEARVIGSTIGIGIIASAVYIRIIREKGKVYNFEFWRYSLSIALPTVLMSLSYMLMQHCDKVMIQKICGSEDTAVYSVIYYIGYAMVAVDQSAAPVRQAWVFRKLDGGKMPEAKQLQKCYLFVMGVLANILILTGPEVLKILAPKEYWRFEYIVPFVLSACMMVLYKFYVEVILFFKSNTALSLNVLFCALINIGLNAALIPRVGAIAACYTTVVAYGILFLLTWGLASNYKKGIYSLVYFAVFVIEVTAVAVIYSILYESIVRRYAVLVAILVISTVYGWYIRREWKNVYREDCE